MKAFAALYTALDEAGTADAKALSLRAYLRQARPADAAWAVFLLAGGRLPKPVPRAMLQSAAQQATAVPDWLFALSLKAVGDFSQTIAHLLPPAAHASDLGLAHWMQRLSTLHALPPLQQTGTLQSWWDELGDTERLLLCQLAAGTWRPDRELGLSRPMLRSALASHAGLPPAVVAQRLIGYVSLHRPPDAAALAALLAPAAGQQGQPCDFDELRPLAPAAGAGGKALQRQLGPVTDWLLSWDHGGLRVQLVREHDQVWLWSQDGDLLTDRFPEISASARHLPEDCVLEGQLLLHPGGRDLAASEPALQRRLRCKRVGKSLQAQAQAVLVVDDLLRQGGICQSRLPLQQRQDLLQALLAKTPATAALRLKPMLKIGSWDALLELRGHARASAAQGLVLRRRAAPRAAHQAAQSRPCGGPAWLLWQNEPLRVCGVLLYAQAGRGDTHTDYSFALWSRQPLDAAEARAVIEAIDRGDPPAGLGLRLVVFTHASSGLSPAESERLDKLVRSTSLQRFGPVRSLRPTLLAEIGFDAVQISTRHKCGLVLRQPRILELRWETPLHEGDTLPALQAMMDANLFAQT